MAVCSDMLEAILGPIHSCKPNDGAQQSISEDSELSRAKNGKFAVLFGGNEIWDVKELCFI